jgi:hypothetical protein
VALQQVADCNLLTGADLNCCVCAPAVVHARNGSGARARTRCLVSLMSLLVSNNNVPPMAQNECLMVCLEELRFAGVVNPTVSRGGKHIQVRWSNTRGVIRMYPVPCTPSDRRSVGNCRAAVRRILREDGMLAVAEPKAPARPPSRLELLERRVAELERRLGAGPGSAP